MPLHLGALDYTLRAFVIQSMQGASMENGFEIPPEQRKSFQRLLPHMVAGLRNDPQGLEAVFLYLKMGGEKMARIAIDAYNQTHRLKNAQMQKLRLEEALMAEQIDESEEDDDDEEEETGVVDAKKGTDNIADDF